MPFDNDAQVGIGLLNYLCMCGEYNPIHLLWTGRQVCKVQYDNLIRCMGTQKYESLRNCQMPLDSVSTSIQYSPI